MSPFVAAKPTVGLDSSDALMEHGPTTLHSFVADKLESAMDKAMPQMKVLFGDLSQTHALHQRQEDATTVNKYKCTAENTTIKDVCGVFKPGPSAAGLPGSDKSSLVLSDLFPLETNVSMEMYVHSLASVIGIRADRLMKLFID
ncbi:hypothetical protein PR003_g29570 [Phytophthora rubi]|uniref:Uncharacterized protein n=1 Tax=Phytophthora rubi TaxID=129364 RepID=A0A6A3HA85_9STRA|nr:hypothetical protein PR002_g28534 [Phytophthora rubi]KAE8966100.1 hypothetical protein PR001_g28511 [Phytophthora rubi]KAE9274564.1 hypothetical protein PR003_g29570 [Phytophthora rubi]